MSIFADTYIVDELTGEPSLVKHLNKVRIHRGAHMRRRKGWNKSGAKARAKKYWNYKKTLKRDKINIHESTCQTID